MPELPDVENYRRYLQKYALRRTIKRVTVRDKRSLRKTTPQKLNRALARHAFISTKRHGKHLFARLDRNGGWLTMHFGMTGRLAYFGKDVTEPKNDRVRFDFTNGHHLGYVDARLLGRIELIDDVGAFIEQHDLGPDALAIGAAEFSALLDGRRGGLKAALMDQALIAGIGNLYADEILFQCGFHPLMPVGKLSSSDRRRIHRSMRAILRTAVKSGAGSEGLYRRLPRTYLIPRRKAGAACPRCGGKVKKIAAAGRSTYLCPRCQKR